MTSGAAEWDAQRLALAWHIGGEIGFVAPGESTDLVWALDRISQTGDREFARLYRFEFDARNPATIWGSRVRYWLDIAPTLSDRTESVSRILRDAGDVPGQQSQDGPDRTLQIRWPTGDHEAATAFLDAGLRPTLQLATDAPASLRDPAAEEARWEVAVADQSDEVGVISHVLELHALEVQLGTFRMPDFARNYLALQISKAVEDEHFLIVQDKARRVLGCLEVQTRPDDPWVTSAFRADGIAILSNLHVDPTRRGQGIARALLVAARRVAPGGVRAVVYAEGNESARRFWNSAGFNPVWTTWRKVL